MAQSFLESAGVAVLAALALSALGCGEKQPVEVELPAGLAARAPDPAAYVKPLGAAVSTAPAAQDDVYLRRFVTTFTSMTPENELKWSSLHPEQDEYDFAAADQLIRVARRTRKRVRGHTLLYDQQLPGWVADGDWSRAELTRVLRDHVRAVVGRYRGRVAEWDVVNEPLDDDGSLTESVFMRVIGPEYIAIAFRAARKADPGARLFLNEIGADRPGPKADALDRLAAGLKRDGVPIDGVGLQNHTSTRGYAPRSVLRRRFRRLDRAGLDVAITEMDVDIRQGGKGAPRRQARAYAAAATACRTEPNCTGVTVWGVTDRHSWIGAEKQPLPFDSEGRPKPALRALTAGLKR